MSRARTQKTTVVKRNKIFISWSGDISKEIAKNIKNVFEKFIFENTGLICFVSDLDIASGKDWWEKINLELKSCKLGILCITKENFNAPWIYYEAGALLAKNIPVIPLLFNCNIDALNKSPFNSKQCVDFYNAQKFQQMLNDINTEMKLLELSETQKNSIFVDGYNKLKLDLSPVLKKLKEMRIFNAKYTYPSNITTITKKTVYVSAPMSSIDDNEYEILREYLLDLEQILKNIGFSDVKCPLYAIEDKNNFDGGTKAIKDNFTLLKGIESMVVIYPQKLPSSVLVEVGYGLALCKKIVIFYKDELPYILKNSGETIAHIKTFKYIEFDEIERIIQSNGMDLFEDENDE